MTSLLMLDLCVVIICVIIFRFVLLMWSQNVSALQTKWRTCNSIMALCTACWVVPICHLFLSAVFMCTGMLNRGLDW